MLIIGDDTREYGKLAWVTFSLVFINIFVFCLQVSLGRSFTAGFALVPEEITSGRDLVRPESMEVKFESRGADRYGQSRRYYDERRVTIEQAHGPFPIYLTLFTCMFLHGDILHLAFNMWFLGVFGRAVEYALQPGRFLAYYLICGVAGSIAHVLADPHSVIPCVGASGAISGVMGSYLAIHPMRKVKMWLGILWCVIEVPAVVVLGIWFLLQYAAAGAALESGVNTGTAYLAHVGGFVAGLFLIWGTIIFYSIKQAHSPQEPEHETMSDMPGGTHARLEDAFRLSAPRADERDWR